MEHTVAIDRMGSMHIWHGIQQLRESGKYSYKPEADVYLQTQADVEMVLESLSVDTQDDLQNGYIVSVVDNYILEEVCNV